MTDKPKTLAKVVQEVKRHEVTRSNRGLQLHDDDALMALGLRAVLAAIGQTPGYRRVYVAKGGTVLRLRSQAYIGRFSKDLDLSLCDVDLAGPVGDHQDFATQVGRKATSILQQLGTARQAEVTVSFERKTSPEDVGENPDTVVYGLVVEAALKPGFGRPTRAEGQGFKIDVTTDEYVDQNFVDDLVIDEFGIGINVRAYMPIQSIAEKLRAILQKDRHNRHKIEQGKDPSDGNLQPRHLLDLATLHDLVSEPAHWAALPVLFRAKCACRQIEVDDGTLGILTSEALYQKARAQDPQRADRARDLLPFITRSAQIPGAPGS